MTTESVPTAPTRAMAAVSVPRSALPVGGHNRITTQALTSTARAAAAEILGVQPATIRATFSDDRGLLALLLALPLPVPPLSRVLDEPGIVASFGGPVLDRADAARAQILARVQELSGARLSRVDIRIIGSTVTKGARVL